MACPCLRYRGVKGQGNALQVRPNAPHKSSAGFPLLLLTQQSTRTIPSYHKQKFFLVRQLNARKNFNVINSLAYAPQFLNITGMLSPLAPSAVQPIKTNYRIASVDVLRGLVMIIMALDHTRDFIHNAAYTDDPLNLQTTTPVLFFTRWITHFCAPVFVFLSGVSAYLQGLRKTKKELRNFLIKRGCWLIVIEIVIMSFIFTFDPSYSFITLSVLWSIGISMIILGLLIKLPWQLILTIGLLIVFGHNLLDFIEAQYMGNMPLILSILHRPSVLPVSNSLSVGNFYNFLPWTGLMLVGYCFGKLYNINISVDGRNKYILLSGLSLLLFFIVLRAINVYGDPKPWSVQRNSLYTFFSFINTNKYPPSLLFMCMTLGPALIFLSAIANVRNRFTAIVKVYGQSPLFYFLLHFFLLRVITTISFFVRGHSFTEGYKGVPNFPFKFIIPGEGYNLLTVYIIWIAIVIVLYPVCKWYGVYKRAHDKWWLRYL
jgi:uncharacterized membrane protein